MENYERLTRLKSTAEQMVSDDYRERLVAEYIQLTTRIDAITDKIKHYHRNSLTPLELDLLNQQLIGMVSYKNVLELRARLMDINIYT